MRFQACDKSYDNFRKRIKKLLKNVKITLNQLGQKKNVCPFTILGPFLFFAAHSKVFFIILWGFPGNSLFGNIIPI